MDIDFAGLEVDPQNPQVLGDLGTRVWQSSPGDFPGGANRALEATSADNEWLRLEESANDGVVNKWGKLKISEGDWDFHSPRKQGGLKSKSVLRSPVSTLTSWSPQAASAPPFKFRRSTEIEVDTTPEISV